jgi:hypothetical protein
MPASSKAFEDAVTYISQATTLSVPSELKLKVGEPRMTFLQELHH